MRIFKLWFRDEQVDSVDTYETWEVRWWSRYSEYSSGTQPEVRAFPTKEGANRFSDALRDAYKLLKHTSGTTVTVKKLET